MRNWVAAAVLVLAAPAGFAQLQPPEVNVRAEAVRPGIWVLYGSGGNIGVAAGADGLFLIDDQFAILTPKIEEALAAIHPRPPRFVLNTHWHGDHTGGNENLAAKGALIVAHDNVRTRMSTDQLMTFFKRAVPAAPPAALPMVTFSDGLSLHVNGDEIRGVHLAHGHTDGDVVYRWVKANVIHTGDLFFANAYPFIDVDSGGSINGLIAAIDRILGMTDDDTRIIPGHGGVSSRARVVEYRRMLAVTSGRLRELQRAGRTVEEVLAARPNADYDRDWAGPFITEERYTRMIWELLERELR